MAARAICLQRLSGLLVMHDTLAKTFLHCIVDFKACRPDKRHDLMVIDPLGLFGCSCGLTHHPQMFPHIPTIAWEKTKIGGTSIHPPVYHDAIDPHFRFCCARMYKFSGVEYSSVAGYVINDYTKELVRSIYPTHGS